MQGLAPVDIVVTAGQLKIRDGTAVRLAGAAADGGTAQSAPAPQVAQAEPAGQKTSDPAKSGVPVKR